MDFRRFVLRAVMMALPFIDVTLTVVFVVYMEIMSIICGCPIAGISSFFGPFPAEYYIEHIGVVATVEVLFREAHGG